MNQYLRLSFVLAATVLAGSPAVEAQNYNPQTGRYQEMKIEDQPGYIPQSEEVPAAFRRPVPPGSRPAPSVGPRFVAMRGPAAVLPKVESA